MNDEMKDTISELQQKVFAKTNENDLLAVKVEELNRALELANINLHQVRLIIHL